MSNNVRRFTIGSDNGCDVVLADESVAPHHVSLDIVPGGPLIVSAEVSDRRTEVVHAGRARAIRKGIVTPADALRIGDVEIPVEEVLVAIKLRQSAPEVVLRGDAPGSNVTPHALAGDLPGRTPLPRKKESAKPEPAGKGPARDAANDRPLTRSLVLPCPACHKPTKSLKRHRLCRLLVFIGVAYWVQTAEYTACQPCMRNVILVRTLVNIPTANLSWPILFVIHAVHFVGTFKNGHSRKVLELLKA